MWELLPLPLKLDKRISYEKNLLGYTPVILVLIVRDFCWVDDTIFLGFFSCLIFIKKKLFGTGEKMEIGVLVRRPRD